MPLHESRIPRQFAVSMPPGIDVSVDRQFSAFLAGLASGGQRVVALETLRAAESVAGGVVFNYQPRALGMLRRFRVPRERRCLVSMEPEVTAPGLYRRRYWANFGFRLAASKSWAKTMQADYFQWPMSIPSRRRDPEPAHGWDSDVSLVAANKRSAIGSSQYGLRRQFLREARHAGLRVALFGPGWDNNCGARATQGAKCVGKALRAARRPSWREAFGDMFESYPEWRGQIPDKGDAMRTAPWSLVIENSRDYVSEKLLDVISHGSVPIYVGPPLALYGIPEEVAVAGEPPASSLARQITCLTESDWQFHSQAGQRWLIETQETQPSYSEAFWDLGHRIASQLLSIPNPSGRPRDA